MQFLLEQVFLQSPLQLLNLDDGSVEILASATDKEFLIFENWCREGPSHARVDRLEISELDQTGFTDFSIDD